MNDEAKLGLVAGVLAVVGVAVFGMPKESAVAAPAQVATAPVAQLPAVVLPAGR
jgi:hypothetical protein